MQSINAMLYPKPGEERGVLQTNGKLKDIDVMCNNTTLISESIVLTYMYYIHVITVHNLIILVKCWAWGLA